MCKVTKKSSGITKKINISISLQRGYLYLFLPSTTTQRRNAHTIHARAQRLVRKKKNNKSSLISSLYYCIIMGDWNDIVEIINTSDTSVEKILQDKEEKNIKVFFSFSSTFYFLLSSSFFFFAYLSISFPTTI